MMVAWHNHHGEGRQQKMGMGQEGQAPAGRNVEPPRFQAPPAPPPSDQEPAGIDEEPANEQTDETKDARRWWHHPARATKYLAGLVVAAVIAFLAGVYLPKWLDRTRDALQVNAIETPDETLVAVTRVYDIKLTPEEYDKARGSASDFATPPGGVQAYNGTYQIMARNVRQSRVVVVGMKAKIVATKPVPQGTAVLLTREGAPEPVVKIGFDLDSTDLRSRVIGPDDHATRQAFFSGTDLAFGPGDTARFVVTAQATKHLYEWRVQIDVFVDGAVVSVLAPAEDQPPFRASGVALSNQAAFTRKGVVDPAQFCIQFPVCGPGRKGGW